MMDGEYGTLKIHVLYAVDIYEGNVCSSSRIFMR